MDIVTIDVTIAICLLLTRILNCTAFLAKGIWGSTIVSCLLIRKIAFGRASQTANLWQLKWTLLYVSMCVRILVCECAQFAFDLSMVCPNLCGAMCWPYLGLTGNVSNVFNWSRVLEDHVCLLLAESRTQSNLLGGLSTCCVYDWVACKQRLMVWMFFIPCWLFIYLYIKVWLKTVIITWS